MENQFLQQNVKGDENSAGSSCQERDILLGFGGGGGGKTSSLPQQQSNAKRHPCKMTLQGKVYNFLERPTGWKCFAYHFTVITLLGGSLKHTGPGIWQKLPVDIKTTNYLIRIM
ncbi:hypothetical protein HELRODRAFT_180574 [Helobdella robusta]|uniref:Uncharacterized protein n=1 Tax=Helobdella robusta TaxID=6412 RepID=T1FG24_HELRO|nr:hypothetical protein HELRODRAFT_180574 [Helobdella robusta]ESN93710.1 hypothetical protein HELRODRAFT_180574 [Helobdella robusta]